MTLPTYRRNELQTLCNSFRKELIELLYEIQTGHVGGSLSCTEIVTVLYNEIMITSPNDINRDRFVLSKGHAAPILYLNLAYKGFFPREELKTLRQIGSRLQGHPCWHKTPGVDVSTGPLGIGLSTALGIAISARMKKDPFTTYVLLGDGEIQEGCIWEAAMSAAKFNPGNLVAIIDHNGVQLDGTNDEIMPLGDIELKFRAFGWKTLRCNGHDIDEFFEAVEFAKTYTSSPVVVIAETIKGKGVSFMEGKNIWHGRPIGHAEYVAAMAELGGEAPCQK